MVGVDLGIKNFAVLSNGEVFEGPKAYRENLEKLKWLSRALSRKEVGSKNWLKAKLKIARLHAHIADIRKDALDKLTTYLTKNFAMICIEDLNISGMMKNGKLSRAIADMGWGEFRRQLAYKAEIYGANRFFPSSKTCSCCGEKIAKLPLSVRNWTCPACGAEHDRDLNAAINLKNLAARSAVSACREDSRSLDLSVPMKVVSVKQEPIPTKQGSEIDNAYSILRATVRMLGMSGADSCELMLAAGRMLAKSHGREHDLPPAVFQMAIFVPETVRYFHQMGGALVVLAATDVTLDTLPESVMDFCRRNGSSVWIPSSDSEGIQGWVEFAEHPFILLDSAEFPLYHGLVVKSADVPMWKKMFPEELEVVERF